MTDGDARAKDIHAKQNIANSINAVAASIKEYLDRVSPGSGGRAHELRVQQRTGEALNDIARAIAGPNREHIELYGVFRDYLKHEDDLINNRLNWNFTIQGFLFAAYSFSLQKIADARVALLNSNIDVHRVGQLNIIHTVVDLHVLLVAIALAGMNTSIFVYLSVRAARIAIGELEKRWFTIDPSGNPKGDPKNDKTLRPWRWFLTEELLGRTDTSTKTHGKAPPCLPGVIGGGHQGANWLGFHAPSFLPLSIAGIWLLLLCDAAPDLWRMIF